MNYFDNWRPADVLGLVIVSFGIAVFAVRPSEVLAAILTLVVGYYFGIRNTPPPTFP